MKDYQICLIVFLSLALIALAIFLMINIKKIGELARKYIPCLKDKSLPVQGRLTDEQCTQHLQTLADNSREHVQNKKEILDKMSANCVSEKGTLSELKDSFAREKILLNNLKEIFLNNPEIFNEGNTNGK